MGMFQLMFREILLMRLRSIGRQTKKRFSKALENVPEEMQSALGVRSLLVGQKIFVLLLQRMFLWLSLFLISSRSLVTISLLACERENSVLPSSANYWPFPQ